MISMFVFVIVVIVHGVLRDASASCSTCVMLCVGMCRVCSLQTRVWSLVGSFGKAA